MKTTLEIADDVLKVAEELARRENKTAGMIISELARRALAGGRLTAKADPDTYARDIARLPSLPRRNAGTVTLELVNKLRERID